MIIPYVNSNFKFERQKKKIEILVNSGGGKIFDVFSTFFYGYTTQAHTPNMFSIQLLEAYRLKKSFFESVHRLSKTPK
jgi:hypothetical protein